ncbi:MAG: cation transporter [Chloroflexi bacterium]|nr:cation transporter [Chloroflexota bacterium]
MANQTFNVPGINCNHCVMTIKQELSELKGVASVAADAGTKTVTVEWKEPATVKSIESLLAEINFPAAK